MKRRISLFNVLALALLLALVTVGPALAAPPPNDDPAGAELIPGAGPFPFYSAVTPDITDATTAGEPVPGWLLQRQGLRHRHLHRVFAG